MIRINNWSIVGDTYSAPELQRLCLKGEVYGHPRIEDGEMVKTSSIKGLDGEHIISYSGTKYQLGSVDPDYEKLYPGAKERLLKVLRKKEA